MTTFTHNRVQAQRGVYIEGTGYNALNQVRAAQLVMDSNRVEGDYSAAATSTGTTTGIQCSGTVNLSVTNNVVQPGCASMASITATPRVRSTSIW